MQLFKERVVVICVLILQCKTVICKTMLAEINTQLSSRDLVCLQQFLSDNILFNFPLSIPVILKYGTLTGLTHHPVLNLLMF